MLYIMGFIIFSIAILVVIVHHQNKIDKCLEEIKQLVLQSQRIHEQDKKARDEKDIQVDSEILYIKSKLSIV